MKLIIGTPQFGMHYGPQNPPVVPTSAVKSILNAAVEMKCKTLDTSPLYGNTERVLGQIKQDGLEYISKLPLIDSNTKVSHYIRSTLQQTLDNLHVSRLSAYLSHDPEQFSKINSREVAEALLELKMEGKTKKVGVSVYTPQQLFRVLDVFTPDVVQAPVNLLDHSFCTPEITKIFIENNMELHARSIFLQGVLLIQQDKLPKYFACWRDTWDQLDDWIGSVFAGERVSGCVEIAKRLSHVTGMVVGVRSVDELKHVVKASKRKPKLTIDLPAIDSTDVRLINPSNWELNT